MKAIMKRTMAVAAAAAVITSMGAEQYLAAVDQLPFGIVANAASASSVSVTASAGYAEGAYAEWTPVSGASGYNVYADGRLTDGMLTTSGNRIREDIAMLEEIGYSAGRDNYA